jgi:uncharacterized PurR-regulated membrane protein YhhQ (DUF165 family)
MILRNWATSSMSRLTSDLGDTRVYFGKKFWASLCLTSKDETRSEKFVELATGDVIF